MNDINTTNQSENLNKSNKWNKLPYTLLLVTLLSLNNPSEAKDLNTYNSNLQNVEVVSDSGIVANVERRTWVVLPRWYTTRVRDFVSSNDLMKRSSAANFTEDFIINQMKSNWWISKQNQLLFIWDAVYEQITKKNFYDWEDWDSNRLSEFENAMDSVEACWKKYKEQFTSYMKWKSAEADRRSAEADRRSTEADRRSAEADRRSAEALNSSIENLVRFYNRYKRDSNTINTEEVVQWKKKGKEVAQRCKDAKIDYKAKLSKEILKFYGIE